MLRRYPNAIPLSARHGPGLDKLAFGVSDALSRTFRDVDVETGVENGRLMAYLAAHGEVLSRRFDGARVTLHCRIPEKYLGRIPDADAVVRVRPGAHRPGSGGRRGGGPPAGPRAAGRAGAGRGRRRVAGRRPLRRGRPPATIAETTSVLVHTDSSSP